MGRAFDQVLMDVALHKAGVTFVLDRSGVTGPDGASHHGMWDLAMLQIVPGIRIAAPRDAATLREELAEAIAVDDAPTVVRFPKGSVTESIPAITRTADGVDVLRADSARDVLLVGVGSMASVALDVAEILAKEGIGSTVLDPRWVIPVAPSIVDFARDHRIVVTIEDGIRVGGVGTRVRQDLRQAGVDTGVDELGLPDEFLEHDTRGNILKRVGLTPTAIAAKITNQLRGDVVPKAKPKKR
jgi:1-deoxy-D-xylulose-5-phosphate synthase